MNNAVLVIQLTRRSDDAGYVQPHLVEDAYLAQLVIADLVERHGGTYESRACNAGLFLDLGGMMIATLSTDESGPLGFWPHQVDGVLAKINKHLGKLRTLCGVRYAKMQGFPHLVCVTEETLKAAKADILSRHAEIDALAERELAAHVKFLEDRRAGEAKAG